MRTPEVDGVGYERLRACGIEVVEADGEIAAEARRLNEAFFHYARNRETARHAQSGRYPRRQDRRAGR